MARHPRSRRTPSIPTGSISPEGRVVLLSAGMAESDAEIRALLRGPIDWHRLMEIGVDEGAHPVLGRRIRQASPDAMPAEVAERWMSIERVAEFRMAYLQRRMEESLERLTAAGIPVVLLKGAALACTTHGSFLERPMSDIDLLVHPARLPECQALLLGSGWNRRRPERDDGRYAEKHHLPPLYDVQAPSLEVGIELHGELFSTLRNVFSFSGERIWSAAEPVAGLPAGVLAPCVEHRLLHCCLHYSWSHLLRKGAWRTIRDVAGISRSGRIDWDRFIADAREARGASCCYWALRLAGSLGHAAVPPEVLERLRPAASDAVLDSLEHHFRHEALERERLCPSGRLRRILWEAAIRPRASGHGTRRPWTRVKPSEEAQGSGRPVSVRAAWRWLTRPAAWLRYVVWVARAGAGARRAATPPNLSTASARP